MIDRLGDGAERAAVARGARLRQGLRARGRHEDRRRHFHIWRQADLPWLTGPMQPRIFGPYEPIRRDYPMAEYLADIAGTGVEKSVYVQANWPPTAPRTRSPGSRPWR
jgi:hypothetical protein